MHTSHRRIAVLVLGLLAAQAHAPASHASTPTTTAPESEVLFDFDPATVGDIWRFDNSDGVSRPGRHKPLAELCDGGPIQVGRYWQAKTVVDLLIEHERNAPRFELLLQGFRDAGSTDVRPFLGVVLGVSWEELERDWREDVARRYGGGG
jgi:hypothetical protein